MVEAPWQPDTLFAFVIFILERGDLSAILRQNPLRVVPGANSAGGVALVLAVYSLVALAVQRRASAWSMGAAGGTLLFILLELALAYRSASNVIATSKTPWKEELLTEACQELLWIPTFGLLTFLVVFAAAVISAICRIARGRADVPDGHGEV